MKTFTSLNDPHIVALLARGAVGIMPTDTIYGIVADAANVRAVERLYRLKQRRDDARSGTVIAANVEQLKAFGIDKALIQRVAHLWPNPLSIEMPLGPHFAYLYQTGPHRAFRVAANTEVRALVEKTGPLLTSSVNISGAPSATNLAQAYEYFGNQVDFYVEGGDLGSRPPSTVAVIQEGKLKVVRQGAVTIDETGSIR